MIEIHRDADGNATNYVFRAGLSYQEFVPYVSQFAAWGPWWLNVQRYRCGMGTFYGVKVGPLALYVRANWKRKGLTAAARGLRGREG